MSTPRPIICLCSIDLSNAENAGILFENCCMAGSQIDTSASGSQRYAAEIWQSWLTVSFGYIWYACLIVYSGFKAVRGMKPSSFSAGTAKPVRKGYKGHSSIRRLQGDMPRVLILAISSSSKKTLIGKKSSQPLRSYWGLEMGLGYGAHPLFILIFIANPHIFNNFLLGFSYNLTSINLSPNSFRINLFNLFSLFNHNW